MSSLFGKVDLVTANPPYAQLGTGTLPRDSQRLAARFETRGGVEDYCLVASKLIAEGTGRFILAFWNRDDVGM